MIFNKCFPPIKGCPMRKLSRRVIWLVGVMVLAAGCGKINVERTMSLDGGEFKVISVDPPRSEQKISVTVNSSGAPIDAYVVLEGDENAALKIAEDTIRSSKPLSSALDGKQKFTEASLNATIPAKKGFSILLLNGGTKKADVKIKITSR
jgi:hypothetical protein